MISITNIDKINHSMYNQIQKESEFVSCSLIAPCAINSSSFLSFFMPKISRSQLGRHTKKSS